MKFKYFIGFLTILLISCSNPNLKYEKFTFEYSKDEDYFNSNDNIFRRNYAVDDDSKPSDSVREIILTDQEIVKIAKSMSENSIQNLPNEFSCDFFPINDPNFINLIINTKNSKEIQFKFNRTNPDLNCTKAKKLLNFTKVLDSIIYNKEDIKNLPPTNLYYE